MKTLTDPGTKKGEAYRIAKALEASPDFLMNGTLQDKSADAIEDEELLLQFRKIEKLPSDKKENR